MKILVHQVVGEDCATIEEGRRLYKEFLPELQAGREVELDFSGVQVATASFLNASLGFLLQDFKSQELSRLVKVSHLEPWAQVVLKRVVENCQGDYGL